jgi:beta-xylosidase
MEQLRVRAPMASTSGGNENQKDRTGKGGCAKQRRYSAGNIGTGSIRYERKDNGDNIQLRWHETWPSRTRERAVRTVEQIRAKPAAEQRAAKSNLIVWLAVRSHGSQARFWLK